MGIKYYRGSEKPDKIRKRLTMSRYWFRDLKWVACKKYYLNKLSYRFRTPKGRTRTSL